MVRRLLLIFLLFYSSSLLAEATASVSRKNLAMDETVMLTLNVSGKNIPEPDLSPLQKDFHIMGESTSQSTRIVNLKRTDHRQWRLHLQPKRTGRLEIPSIKFDDQATEPLHVNVQKEAPPKTSVSGMPLFLESSVSTVSALPQQEVLYTLRLFNAVPNAEPRSIDKLEISNAIVKNTESMNYHKTVAGKQYLVWEFRYFIYPETSGEVEIPSLKLSLRVPHLTSYGRTAYQEEILRSRAHKITVNSAPVAPEQQEWLSAKHLNLTQGFSTDITKDLSQGDSFTRTISISTLGQMAEQLPDITSDNIKGARIYSEKPELETRYPQHHSVATKTVRQEVLLSGHGKITLPEIKVIWWNTDANEFQETILDPVELNVLPAVASGNTAGEKPLADTTHNSTNSEADLATNLLPTTHSSWLILFGISVAINIALLFLLYLRPQSNFVSKQQRLHNQAKPDLSQLNEAFNQGNAAETRRLLGKLMRENKLTCPSSNTLSEAETQLNMALQKLDQAIAGAAKDDSWRQSNVVKLLEDAIEAKNATQKKSPLKELYPQ